MGRFGDLENSAESLGVYNGYLCPEDDFNFKIRGSYSTQTAELVEIRVDYCD